MDRTIIVGYDGSEGAEDALALAELLAAATGWRAAPAFVAHGEEDERAAEAAALLRRRSGGADGRPATLTLRSARSTAEGLAGLADSTGAGAVVVGSSHRGALGQVLGGSVPQALLSGGPCAVAVAPRGYAARAGGPIATVGVGFDDRPESRAALAVAAGLAARLGAELRVIGVVAPQPGMYVPSPLAADEYTAYLRAMHARQDELADEAVRSLARPELKVAAETLDGFPGPLLEDRSAGLDLLVIGTRAHGPLRRVMLGSVSAHLVRHCSCPLLIVPRSPLAGRAGDPSASPEAAAAPAGESPDAR